MAIPTTVSSVPEGPGILKLMPIETMSRKTAMGSRGFMQLSVVGCQLSVRATDTGCADNLTLNLIAQRRQSHTVGYTRQRSRADRR